MGREHEKRRHRRYNVQSEAILTLSDGEAVAGVTRNISLEGAYLEVRGENIAAKPDDRGILVIILPEATIELACQVAHLQSGGVGLRLFQDKRDQLGFALTMELLENAALSPE